VNRDISIALDAMGGDVGPPAVVRAAMDAVRAHPRLRLTLVGRASDIDPVLEATGAQSDRIVVHHAEQIVGMDESPAAALRSKKDSSMRVAINLVKEGRVDACVSALPGIDRPAICTTIPSLRGHTHVLDLGANVDSKSEHLLQFAIMGSEMVKAVDDVPRPKVALLNVGQEDIKGNDQVKQAALLLDNSDLNYVGYAEGDGIYTGDHDVVVCDGFVGNVALKSSEGVARVIRKIIRDEFQHSALTRLAGLAASPVLKSIAARIDPRQYNGASLLGLSGVVIKSHGDADAFAFGHAIDIAMIEAQKDVPSLIRAQLETSMVERQAV
jgi:glycerol-3-phosphate acyltransferase PlsX